MMINKPITPAAPILKPKMKNEPNRNKGVATKNKKSTIESKKSISEAIIFASFPRLFP